MLKLPEVRKSAVVANVGRKMRNVVAAVLAAAAIALTPTAASDQTSSDAGNAVTQVSSQSPLLMLQSDFGLGSSYHYSHSSHSSHASHSSHTSSRW